MAKYKWTIISIVAIMAGVGLAEHFMGRLALGPDGRFGFWDNNIWGSENSQRLFDAYSFTHIVHGFIWYFLLWLFARRLPVKYRLIAAVILEACWELFENSPLGVNRYRSETIALGYAGDSILNSLSDISVMMFGYFLAWKTKVWQGIIIVAAIELGLLFWIRDNLTLNIIMLTHPIESIKVWQSLGRLK